MGPLEFHTERRDGRILLSGELDVDSASALREELSSLADDVLTLDLSALSFVDSSGIAALLWLRRAHPSMHIVGITPRLRELLRVVGLEDVLADDDGPTPPGGRAGA